MRTIAAVLCLVAASLATPLQSGTIPRRYFPEEEHEDRIKHIFWEDNQGELQVEDLFDPLNNMSTRANINDVTIHLYTKESRVLGEIIRPKDFSTLTNSEYFKKERISIFLVHGWNNNYQSPVNTLLTTALLKYYDINVFVVDWSGPANRNYLSAKWAVPEIGEVLGDFINEMIAAYKISSKSINLIGHSLGAHVSGCAGARVPQKVNFIVGLDPASPLFTLGNTDNRIDPTDADHVQIIHTNGGKLGFASSIGHSDYYPNGGGKQPGCGFDLIGTCAHARAYMYLAESIEKVFNAHLCDSYSEYDRGNCVENQESFLGGFSIDKGAYGDYYLNTNKKEPFAQL